MSPSLDLTNNITGIFRKFLNEGKCTISFKLPEIDLQIRANAIQLKAFLQVMKQELFPGAKKDPDDNKMLRAFANTNKMITDDVKKLVITKRSEFPSKGFPRTLQDLQIIGVGCLQMPIGVLNLVNLTSLDLSSNQITKIHKSLGNLRLKQLIIADNKLNESVWADYQWMNGKNLQSSLQLLNISKNKLTWIPNIIACFRNLVTLNLSSNKIEKLPFAIQHLKSLRYFNLSDNKIQSLPCTFSQLILDDIDLSQNMLNICCRSAVLDIQRVRHAIFWSHYNGIKFATLFELSARVVLNKKIPYTHQNIPRIIKELLFFAPTCSRCSNFCFDRKVEIHNNIIEIRTKTIKTDNNQKEFNAYGPVCSLNCLRPLESP
jgi:LRR-repeat protein 1